jgi:uncharacterized membrane protein (DUF2068 family)
MRGAAASTSMMGVTNTITVKPNHRDHHRGLRTVSILEAAKGVLVVLAAFGFLEIVRHNIDLDAVAQNLLYFFHVNPNLRLSHVLMRAAGKMMDADVLTVLGIATVYSSLRFIESYGLWRQRVWAEWLAIISGAIYLPYELYKLVRRPTALHWAILLINIGVVVYIAWVRWDDVKGRASRHPASARFVEHGD